MNPKNKELVILQQIRKIRNKKGYSQQYLAMRLGIDQSAYQKIESGVSSIKLHQFFNILDILEINSSKFLHSCFEPKFSNLAISNKFTEIERLLNEIKTHSLS